MLIAQTIFALLLIVATVVPFFPIAHGIVRIGDFPRQQIVAIALVCAALSFIPDFLLVERQVFLVVFLGIAAFQAFFILEFTPVWRKQTKSFQAGVDEGERFRLVAANVKMSNRDAAAHQRIIEAADPDLLILMETDQRWIDDLQPLLSRYREVITQPLDNAYGMVFASKFPLHDVSCQDLLTEGVPSIFATVCVTDDLRFRLYSIHPEPPVPHRGTEGRDGETSLIALRTREEKGPVVVTGDLNDVAWSKTTRRFRRVSGLLDPRVGRRMINTFDARYWFMRWPLDHLFHSAHFRLIDMNRLEAGGSDHFPVQFDLMLCPDKKAEDVPDRADADDIERARDLVRQARERDEEPIGSDWEK